MGEKEPSKSSEVVNFFYGWSWAVIGNILIINTFQIRCINKRIKDKLYSDLKIENLIIKVK
jgi:hypothetical protein